MKILAFSDLHRNVDLARRILEHAKYVDVVIGAGDFGTKGKGTGKTLKIFRDCSVPVLVVAGNHDKFSKMQEVCESSAQLHLLHGNGLTLGGVDFFGLGGEIPAKGKATNSACMSEEAASGHLQNCPQRAILITHSPPLNSADLHRSGKHRGSQSIRNIIIEKQPVLHLCGHVHFAWGKTDIIGNTQVHNLGPFINIYELQNEPGSPMIVKRQLENRILPV